MTILRNCRLLKELTEGYEYEFADILIDGKYISKIRPVGFDFGVACEEIDAKNNTLIPGLFELHAHLYGFIFSPFELQVMTPGRITFGVVEFAKEYLKQGYTTIRDCGSSHNAVPAVRDAINAGIIDGPRLISSGLIITPTEIGNCNFADLYCEADGPGELRKAARIEFQKGNDFIKYMGTGAMMNEGGQPGMQIATEEEMRALVEVAKMRGSYVAIHCHGTEAIKAAIRAGVRTVEHGTFIDEEGIQMLKDSKNCYMVVTESVSMFCLESNSSGITPDMVEKNREALDKGTACKKAAYKAGLKLGFGSDLDMVSIRDNPGYEFIARKKVLDYTDLDILMQATKYSAEIAGLGDVTGTIKEGKYSDLVLVPGNPDEDIYAMTKPMLYVFKEGKKMNID